MTGHPARVARGQGLAVAFKAMHRESQGIWQLRVVFPDELPTLIVAAFAGDQRARQLLAGFQTILSHATRERGLCLLCDHEFGPERQPAAIVFLSAYRDDPA